MRRRRREGDRPTTGAEKRFRPRPRSFPQNEEQEAGLSRHRAKLFRADGLGLSKGLRLHDLIDCEPNGSHI